MKHHFFFWTISLFVLCSCHKKKAQAPDLADIMYSNMKDTTVNREQIMFFDINKDGSLDLILKGENAFYAYGGGSKWIEVQSQAADGLSYGSGSGSSGQRYLFEEGSPVFSGADWINNMLLKYTTIPSGKENGFWDTGRMKGYVGLRLKTKLGLCYGWARISLSDSGAVTLHEYALNKKADQPIVAGQKE